MRGMKEKPSLAAVTAPSGLAAKPREELSWNF
jgi:hypothetical protein